MFGRVFLFAIQLFHVNLLPVYSSSSRCCSIFHPATFNHGWERELFWFFFCSLFKSVKNIHEIMILIFVIYYNPFFVLLSESIHTLNLSTEIEIEMKTVVVLVNWKVFHFFFLPSLDENKTWMSRSRETRLESRWKHYFWHLNLLSLLKLATLEASENTVILLNEFYLEQKKMQKFLPRKNRL